FYSSRGRHTRFSRDWSSDVCSSDLWRRGWRSSSLLGVRCSRVLGTPRAVGLLLGWFRRMRGAAGPCARGAPGVPEAPVALGGDETVEPAHLALDLLESVTLQLERVLVEPLAGASRGLPDRLQPLREPGAPALEDADAGLGVRLREEREPDVEALVLPRGRPGGGQHALE